MTADEHSQQVVKLQTQSIDLAKAEGATPDAKVIVRPLQVHALVGYYTILLVVAVTLLIVLILKQSSVEPPLLAMLGFVASGAMVGSVLYQIRMLFRYYVKDGNFDSKWLSKYMSAPWEAIALALVVLSLLQGGGVVLGGAKFDLKEGTGFAAFGIGALVLLCCKASPRLRRPTAPATRQPL
jgi:hypothetical protein